MQLNCVIGAISEQKAHFTPCMLVFGNWTLFIGLLNGIQKMQYQGILPVGETETAGGSLHYYKKLLLYLGVSIQNPELKNIPVSFHLASTGLDNAGTSWSDF